MTQDVSWYIFHIYNKDDKILNLDAKKTLSFTEMEELSSRDNSVNEFFASQNVAQSVFANRNDVIQTLENVAAAYGAAPQAAQQIMEQAISDISRRFANLCSLFRSFLDHTDRHFKYRYGAESLERQKWKKDLSLEYDSAMSYAIVDMVRNYIQHYDMPPLSFHISESAEIAGFKMEIDLDLRELLKDQKVAAKLRRVGFDVPDRYSLRKVIIEWSECFERIVTKVNLVRAKDVLDSAKIVIAVRPSLDIGSLGRLALMSLPNTEKKPEKVSFKIRYLEEDKARAIVSFVEQSLSPGVKHAAQTDTVGDGDTPATPLSDA